MAYFFDNLKNNFDFFLRKNLTFSRKNYFEKTENLSEFKNNDLYKDLSVKYDLDFLSNSTKYNFKLNLYFLDVFDKYFSKKEGKIKVLDIGSKNWEYSKSEYLFFKTFNSNLTLEGIELDSNRLNSKFFSRYEIAKFYTKYLENTKYITGDFLNHREKYDYIIWILPFITEYPLVRWGLPLKYFNPEKMLSHACDSLNDGGELLIINQGKEEYSIQKDLYQKLNLKSINFGEIKDKLNLFKNKRYCSKVINLN